MKKNPWNYVACTGCFRRVRFDTETLRTEDHVLMRNMPGGEVLCPYSGDPIERSRLPGWHPRHEHGTYCDGVGPSGQLKLFGDCWEEARAGPPSAVDTLGDLVDQ